MNSAILEKEPESIAVDPNEILTVDQAARVLKVSYSHMLRLIRGEVNGMPPVHHVRAGRSMRIRRGALTDWIRNVENQSVTSDVQRAFRMNAQRYNNRPSLEGEPRTMLNSEDSKPTPANQERNP